MEFPIPTAGSGPGAIKVGADGNLWFTETDANQIASITPQGTVVEYKVPTADSRPTGIARGADGNIWFAETAAAKIGRIAPDGTITEYPLSDETRAAYSLTLGPDGNIWFTDRDRIGKITPRGEITEYWARAFTEPNGIVAGSDGNLWFTESDRFGKITTEGVVTEFALSDFQSRSYFDRQLWTIALGSDGNVWANAAGAIWRMSPTGESTYFPVASNETNGIAAGALGELWFVSLYGNTISRITNEGTIHDYPIPTADCRPFDVTKGPDDNIWFLEQKANKIGVLVTSSLTPDKLLTFDPKLLSFSAPTDVFPTPQSFTVSAPDPASITVSASSFGPWLQISPSSELTTDVVITARVNVKALPCGPAVYSGAVTLAMGAIRQTLPVRLEVLPPVPSLGCSPK